VRDNLYKENSNPGPGTYNAKMSDLIELPAYSIAGNVPKTKVEKMPGPG